MSGGREPSPFGLKKWRYGRAVPRFRPTARLTCAGLRATGDRIAPTGLSDLVDSLVSDGVPAAPVRLAWG